MGSKRVLSYLLKFCVFLTEVFVESFEEGDSYRAKKEALDNVRKDFKEKAFDEVCDELDAILEGSKIDDNKNTNRDDNKNINF